MEGNILEQMYYGKIVPCENRKDHTPEREPFRNQIDTDTEFLKTQLDESGRKILERILDNSAELEQQAAAEGFKEGVRFGMQLMAAGFGCGK